MSSSAYWRPVIETPLGNLLPDEIKHVLARKYQDHDGSLSGKTILNHEHIPYLEGLRDAGNGKIANAAEDLIEAIEKHEEIEFEIIG